MAWPSFWLIDTSRTIRPESTTTAVFVCYFKLKSSYPWREYAFATPQTASAVIVAKTTAVHAASSACCPWFCEAWRRRAMEIDFNSPGLAQDDVSIQGMWSNQNAVGRLILMESLFARSSSILSSTNERDDEGTLKRGWQMNSVMSQASRWMGIGAIELCRESSIDPLYARWL